MSISEDWTAAVEAVRERGGADATRAAERVALTLLAAGRVDEVAAGIESIPLADRSLLLDILLCDVTVRAQRAALHDIEILDQRARTSADAGGDDYTLWTTAVRCEYLTWKSDPLGFELAHAALRDVTEDSLPPTHILVPRGRLRRVDALGQLFTFDLAGPKAAWSMLEEALIDFYRAGWTEEHALTSGLFAAMWSIVSWEDSDRARQVLEEVVLRFRMLESPYLCMGLVGLASICLLGGDAYAMHRALDEAETVDPGLLPSADSYVRFLRGLAGLLGTGPDAKTLDYLEESASRFASFLPGGTGSTALAISAALADFGEAAAARRWLMRAEHEQLLTPYSVFNRDALGARIRILEDADDDAADDVVRSLELYRNLGLPRWGAMIALRAARDCERVGMHAASEQLRADASKDLPPADKRTLWEALLTTPLHPPTAPAVDITGPPNELRLLAPDVHVSRDGDPIRLASGPARLLVLLAAEQRPMTVDRLADLLWPEVDPASGRNRLNVAIHRLRKALQISADELLIREGDGVHLEPGDTWRIDTWEFWELSNGDAGERARAIELYGSDLCARQFAYDDAIDDERRTLQARWIDTAIELLSADGIDPVTLSAQAQRIGIEDDRMCDALAHALEAVGRHAEAQTLRTGRVG